MVNFTVSIPEDLKAEMDKFPDVNWSELTRKSIQNYLQNRKNMFPPLEFDLKEVHFAYSHDLMQPSMSVSLKVTKSSDSQLIIDRMLFTVKFVKEHFIPHGEDYKVVEARERRALVGVFKESLLNYDYIIKSVSDVQVHLSPRIDLLRHLNDNIKSTFWVDAFLMAYVQGFEQPAIKNLSIKIPIDEWKNDVMALLNNYDVDWNQVHAH